MKISAMLRVMTLVMIMPVAVPSARAQEPQARPGEGWAQLTTDGAWCWFSDPRALWHDGSRSRLYAGWASGDGSLVIGAFDPAIGEVQTHVIHNKLQTDDHISPSLLFLPDGRLAIFYSRHSSDEWMYLAVTRQPEAIDAWEGPRSLRLHDGSPDSKASRDFCYSNPAWLAKESQFHLFWRGLGRKPTWSTSADLQAAWTPGQVVIQPVDTYSGQRPYVKIDSDGDRSIHLAFTDGHPRNEPTNGIAYARYQDGKFLRADGSLIAESTSLPFDCRQGDVVYDARQTNVRAWVWDVAQDAEGRPVIAYTRLPDEQDHRYHYASWDGTKWLDHEVAPAGGWFPQTAEGATEREPHYSGGIVLDHQDPRVVYLSIRRNGRFEIEKWSTNNRGETWNVEPITRGSAQDNVRPVAVRNARAGNGPRVIWMNLDHYVHYTNYHASLRMDLPPESVRLRTD